MLVISSMVEFEAICKEAFASWFSRNYQNVPIKASDVYTVWLSKTLQNSKCILSTNVVEGIMAEYTYNGNSRELYEDVYKKLTNRVIAE